MNFSIDLFKFVIDDVYIPPQAPSFIYESHLQTVESVIRQFLNHTLNHIFCGNYNFPEII